MNPSLNPGVDLDLDVNHSQPSRSTEKNKQIRRGADAKDSPARQRDQQMQHEDVHVALHAQNHSVIYYVILDRFCGSWTSVTLIQHKLNTKPVLSCTKNIKLPLTCTVDWKTCPDYVTMFPAEKYIFPFRLLFTQISNPFVSCLSILLSVRTYFAICLGQNSFYFANCWRLLLFISETISLRNQSQTDWHSVLLPFYLQEESHKITQFPLQLSTVHIVNQYNIVRWYSLSRQKEGS